MSSCPVQVLESKRALLHQPVSLDRFVPFPAASRNPMALLADDDPDMLLLARMALDPYQITVHAAANGGLALAYLRARKYSLVLLDLGLPDMNGLEVLNALRHGSAENEVPVLIITGDRSTEAMARSFNAGAQEFVMKPFNLRELGLRASRLIDPRCRG
jgi:DNA-binding response OmpR family regulator